MRIIKKEKISLKDFLKKYTEISNKFIDDCYKFYEMCENNKHGIYVDDVVKYLNLKVKKYLQKSWEKNIQQVKIL